MIAKFPISLLVIFLLTVNCDEDVSKHLPGFCPDYPVMLDFETELAAGQWYAIAYGFQGRNIPVPLCASATVQFDDNNLLKEIAGYNDSSNKTVSLTIEGPQTGNKPGKYLVEVSLEPGETEVYTVLLTNYKNFMSVIRCKDFGSDGYGHNVVIVSRQQTLSDQFMKKATKVIEDVGFQAPLEMISQKDC